MSRAARKPHPSDVSAARMVARAREFTAHFRAGPSDTVTERHGTAADALAAAERLSRELGRHGRRACAYAVTPEGFTVLLTPAVLALCAPGAAST